MGKPKGKNKQNNTKTVPKTRKEIRKEKRIQKKENKNKFFSKKNEKFDKNQEKIIGRLIRPLKNSKNSVQIPKNINNDGNDILNTTADDIESDFELSDEEMNEKLNKISNKNTKQSRTTIKQKSKPQKIEIDRFHQNQEREKRKQKELEKKTRKRRIQQLREANEEEDRIIRKLEKKLKIDKHKNDKSVHKMFSSDGLDYALELCLPENIEKMYTAAKEASKLNENENGDDFEEDIRMALNRRNGNNLSGFTAGEKETKKNNVKDSAEKVEKKKQVKLKKIENKYFNDEFDINTGSGNDDDDSSSSIATDREDNIDDDNDDDDELSNTGNDIENDENDSEIDYDENEVESDDSESQEENEVKKNENKSKNTKSKEEFDEKDYEDSDQSELDANDKTLEQNSEENQKSGDDNDVDGTWEDIYGRKRDKHGNIITETTPQLESGKYIPPHVRRSTTTVTDDDGNGNQDEYSVKNKERLDNLRRICKGYLNRLSEANMHKISTDIENLYTKNSRYDMNNTLCKLIDDALVLNVLSKERLVLEHTMLIAVLHANIGNEVGAQFLQFIINKFHQMIINVLQLEVEDKKLDNIICILSHLYTFKVFQHNLIFEIINKLIENLCEKTVECILLILRSVGFQLRKDDPLALKELISKIQKKAMETTSSDIKDNPRLKFMLDCLNAIKNNNMNKIPNYDPTLAEHLKKILKSILVNGKYVTTLNITLDDLLNADEKGKWWIVGSAWTGNIKDMGLANQLSNKLNSNYNNKTEMFSEKLLELAKAQKMNTEDRKNIFCIIMSAEDYLDAFERLLHLSIKDNRLIGSIIVHCCLSEKQFNPYYAVLAQKFCEYDRKYQLAFQFCLWDRIREIHSSTKTQLQNLSQFLIHLILNGGLPISVLKIIEFAELDKVSLKFTRQTVLGILLADEEECKRVFERIAPSMKLNTFKDCIRLFMHHFLLRESKKSKNISVEQMKLLKRRVSLVDGILEFVGTKVKF